MGTINSQRQGGLTASADLSAKQYYLVIESGVRTVNVPAGAGVKCIGVLENKPTINQAASVLVGPEVKVRLGATVTAGQVMTTAADGRAAVATTGNFILGQFLEGGNADDIVAAIFEPQGVSP